MWEELLKEIAIIKWGVVCMAASFWGITIYFLLQEIPRWWCSFDKKKVPVVKPNPLEQRNKDLAAATRPRTRGKSLYGPEQ